MNNQLDKLDFLKSLEDSSLPVKISEDALEEVNPSNFNEFNEEDNEIEERESFWNESYFRTQLSILKLKNFSKERCKHLVDVKSYLQKNKIKGFDVDTSHYKNKNLQNDKSEMLNFEISLPTIEKLLEDSTDLLKEYQPEEDLRNEIGLRDINEVQNTLKFKLNNNRLRIQEIIQSMLFVYQKLPETFLEYQEDKFSLATDNDEDVWNKDYFLLQQSYLNHNFALERLMHLINVRDYLSQKGVEGFEHIEVQPKPQINQNPSSYSNTQRLIKNIQENDFMRTAVMIGGAVLAGILALIAITR